MIVECPPQIAAFYMSRAGSWRLRVLAGMISAPVLREDGTVLSQPGYDPESGLLLVSNEDWPAIPDQPTRDDAKAAVEILCAPFEEFPFVAEEDRAVHIAAVLTAIQRRMLEACPLFGYSAPAQRSGKSLLAESVALIATGKSAPATAVSGDHEELRKAIAAALREGHSIINLDNIEIPLTSPDLARAITQSEYQDRLLGESRMLRLPTNVLWTATGNNLAFRRDLASRALLCRIDSGLERPEERVFQVKNLKQHILKHRQELVAAAITILRAYFVAGRPDQKLPSWGGFDEWSSTVRAPLIWLGMADPCVTRQNVVEDDPDREQAAILLSVWQNAFGNEPVRIAEILECANSDSELNQALIAVASSKRDDNKPDARRLGWFCRTWRDRVVKDLILVRAGEYGKAAQWRVMAASTRGVTGINGITSPLGNTAEGSIAQTEPEGQSPSEENDPADPTDSRNSDLVAPAASRGRSGSEMTQKCYCCPGGVSRGNVECVSWRSRQRRV